MLGRLVKAMVLLGLLAVLGLAGSYAYLKNWSESAHDVGKEVIVEFKPGTSLGALSDQLRRTGVITNGKAFHLWGRLAGNYQRYQAGRYRFTGAVSPDDVTLMMIKGQTYNPVVLQITVPEGFTSEAVAERLAANGVGHIAEIKHLLHDRTFLAQLKVPGSTLEGFLYPATYDFFTMPTASEALAEMVKNFWKNLPKGYETGLAARGLKLEDAVTFASLIELETRIDEEKPLISEVIWRRLKDRVPLGIDAALIYGIPDYDGMLHSVNLVDRTNPYNTRIHQGLPPSAIGSPSAKSLQAVLTPSNFGYYYYVLIAGQGRHHFSRTLAEHNLNVKKLVNASKQEKGKDHP